MHSIVLLTAMTATSGLFGGHHKAARAGCHGGGCARPAAVAYAPCTTGQCGTPAYTHAAPRVAYAPTPQAAPALTYNSYYSAPAATCTTGTCPRR